MKTEAPFDAVKTMRELREQIAREIQGMSFVQQREYIERNLRSQGSKARSGEPTAPRSSKATPGLG